MAKRQRTNIIAASFHYLVRTQRNDDDPNNPFEIPITDDDFQNIVNRLNRAEPLDETDPDVIDAIKAGREIPLSGNEVIDGYLYFGEFDGAYYGQQYRNNVVGVISAESLNLRRFNYLITRLRDGKIIIGVTYNGNFGDYEGLRRCIVNLLQDNRRIESRSLKSISTEIGDGEPIEISLHYANRNPRPGHRNLFDRTGVIAVKRSEYGEGFEDDVGSVARKVQGSVNNRKRILAEIVSEGGMLELDDEDIIGCTAVVQEGRARRTVYLLGENNFATKFALNVTINAATGMPNREEVKTEMIRVMRTIIIPMMRQNA